MSGRHPIEPQVVLLAGAKASVTPERLSELLGRAQQHVRERRATYDRRFERVEGTGDRIYYLVEETHWAAVGDELDLNGRESDALGRTHAEQFERDGRRLDRLGEFETALDIRDVVVLRASR